MFLRQLSPLVLALTVSVPFSANALDLVVTTAADPSEAGKLSLRDAIVAVKASTETVHTITFAPALDEAVITLSSGSLTILRDDFPEDGGGIPIIPPGDPISVSIDASSLAGGITIDGDQLSRIFQFDDVDVSLMNLTLQDGKESGFANGGGILAEGGSLDIQFCKIEGCRAALGDGGGLYCLGVSGSILSSKIQGNSAFGSGGGMLLNSCVGFALSSTELSGNSADNGGGGGVSSLSSSIDFTNCTIQGNKNSGVKNEGSSNAVFENCIVSGNTAASGSTADRQITNAVNTTSTISFSLIQGANQVASFSSGPTWGVVTWGGGNLNGVSLAPSFIASVSAASAPQVGADLRLKNGSPGIDQGSNGLNSDTLDAGGKPRIKNTTIDLGAFEGNFTSFALLYPTLAEGDDENENGLTNLQEYGLGLDPTSLTPVSADELPKASGSGGTSFLTLRQRDNGIDLSTSWITSSDLDLWESMEEGVHYQVTSTTPISTERVEVVLTLLNPGPWRFYKQGFFLQP